MQVKTNQILSTSKNLNIKILSPPTPKKTPKREQLTRMYSLKQAPSDKTLELENLK